MSISLESNLLGNVGCELLASGLRARVPGGGLALPSLTELELKDNRVGNSGIAALVHAFPAVPTLQYFGLSDNRVDDVAALALGATALPRLVALDLSHNKIAAQGVRAIVHAVSAGAWPHMAPHRRDSSGKAELGRHRRKLGELGRSRAAFRTMTAQH